jgi:hypothetical protein
MPRLSKTIPAHAWQANFLFFPHAQHDVEDALAMSLWRLLTSLRIAVYDGADCLKKRRNPIGGDLCFYSKSLSFTVFLLSFFAFSMA